MPIESIDAEGGVYRPEASSATIVVTLEGSVVRTIVLGEGTLTIGRLPQNGLVLAHPTVSRYHAEIRLTGGVAAITDVGSSSGTFVGEAQLAPNQPATLGPSAVARIGPFELTFTAAVSASPPIASAPPPAVAGGNGARDSETETLFPVRARPTFPIARVDAARSRYLRHLPALFQDNEFLGRMLLIYESLWEPLERRQDHIAMYFDPLTCPASFLPWLAGWLDLTLDPHWPEDRRRGLLAEAMDLYRWRGTAYGLARMIEVSTGLTPSLREDPAQPFVFHVSLHIPAESGVRREVVEALVRAHKPAHVGYVLEIT